MIMKKQTLVRGVGVNDADYPVYVSAVIGGERKALWECPFYMAWKSMLARCYSNKYQDKNPTYAGCSVTPEWLKFSVFREWMATQDHEGKQLDKDILIAGNKVYGPDTCVFVSRQLNMLMVNCMAPRGEWPVGVGWHKSEGRLRANCCNPFTGKREFLGYFDDPDLAHEAWRARKHELACQYADMQKDPRIAAALRARYADTKKESNP